MNTTDTQPTFAGLSASEISRYSIARAVRLIWQNPDGAWHKKLGGLEFEASRVIEKSLGPPRHIDSFYVPLEIQHRADIVGNVGTGGYLVETTNVGFVDLLRNRTVAFRLGAMPLSGLVGSVNIPKQTADASAVWQSTETTTITEGEQTLGQLSLTPHPVGAYTEVSRLLLLQSSPDVEFLLRRILTASLSVAVDGAAMTGTGSAGQPHGIVGLTGVATVSGSTLGLSGLTTMQTDAANANIEGDGFAYAASTDTAQILKNRNRFSGTDTPLWQGSVFNGTIEGCRAMASKQLPTATMIGGDWTAMTIADWGTLQIEVNPYANFQQGIVGVRCIFTVDIGVRYPGAFAVATTIT